MTNIDDVIEGLKKVWDAFNSMEHELYADYVFDALALLKDYRQHLQNDLETLKEEKQRLEFEHETKAFIYKEQGGLVTIKISNDALTQEGR